MKSVRDFAAAKASRRKIVMSTVYDAAAARILSEAPIDCFLVGDSAMMVVHGERDTLGATVEIMATHTRAVAKGAGDTLVVADMPFLASRRGVDFALTAAAELMRAGAQAVKIEGIRGHLDTIRWLVDSGIPVMGHLGLLPQSVHAVGGFRVQGRDPEAADRLQEEAVLLENAGAFAIVLECVPRSLAKEITAARTIPTIGIGAGPDCDGQVLVFHDYLGLNPGFNPRFVRQFADGAALIKSGATKYAAAVRSGRFPAARESF